MNTRSPTYMCTCRHTHVWVHTDIHTLSHTLSHTCEHGCTPTRTHTLTLRNTPARTHSLTHAHRPAVGQPTHCRPLLSWPWCPPGGGVLSGPPRGGRQQRAGVPGRVGRGLKDGLGTGPEWPERLPMSGAGLGSMGWFQTQTRQLCAQIGPPTPARLCRPDTQGYQTINVPPETRRRLIASACPS